MSESDVFSVSRNVVDAVTMERVYTWDFKTRAVFLGLEIDSISRVKRGRWVGCGSWREGSFFKGPSGSTCLCWAVPVCGGCFCVAGRTCCIVSAGAKGRAADVVKSVAQFLSK